MAVSFKVIDNRTSISKKIKELEQKLDNFRRYFLEAMAHDLITLSPADTGNYIQSHRIAYGTVGGTTTSIGKKRYKGAAKGMFAPAAEAQLLSDIAALPTDGAMTSIKFTNIAEYADKVEYTGWQYTGPYKTYTITRNRANIHVESAAAKAGLK
jgi:hypothetical protein